MSCPNPSEIPEYLKICLYLGTVEYRPPFAVCLLLYLAILLNKNILKETPGLAVLVKPTYDTDPEYDSM